MSRRNADGGLTVIRAGRARRTERGAALVEAAIAVPLVFMILFGMIDFGSVYNDYISIRQGAREGARAAAVMGNANSKLPNGTCPTTGITQSGEGYNLICFTKGRIALVQANTRVSVEFNVQSAPTAPFNAGKQVVICVQYPATSLTGSMKPFFNNSILTTNIAIRIEQDDTSFAAPVQETPLTSWPTSCNAAPGS